MDAAPARLWIGAVLLIGGIAYALFQSPVIGVVACVVGVAILKLSGGDDDPEGGAGGAGPFVSPGEGGGDGPGSA